MESLSHAIVDTWPLQSWVGDGTALPTKGQWATVPPISHSFAQSDDEVRSCWRQKSAEIFEQNSEFRPFAAAATAKTRHALSHPCFNNLAGGMKERTKRIWSSLGPWRSRWMRATLVVCVYFPLWKLAVGCSTGRDVSSSKQIHSHGYMFSPDARESAKARNRAPQCGRERDIGLSHSRSFFRAQAAMGGVLFSIHRRPSHYYMTVGGSDGRHARDGGGRWGLGQVGGG